MTGCHVCTATQDKKGNIMHIKEVVRAPYICTVPGGGVRAIKCYPDAKTFIINGKRVGYSAKERTLICPLDCTGCDIKHAIVVINSALSSRSGTKHKEPQPKEEIRPDSVVNTDSNNKIQQKEETQPDSVVNTDTNNEIQQKEEQKDDAPWIKLRCIQSVQRIRQAMQNIFCKHNER